MSDMDITNLEALQELAATVLAEGEKERAGAFVVALHGDLGTGKTTFTQTLAHTLGVADEVTSPTFVIMKGYELEGQPFARLIHIDAYRIEEIDEMRVLGFRELLQQKDTIMCIEWAEQIAQLLPTDTLHLNLTLSGEKRSVSLSHGS